MAWPDWIEELKERYLADEANAFLLHGAVQGTTFDAEGSPMDCPAVLRAFLSRTRPIVGTLRPWPRPARIEFAGIADRTRFENLVKAQEFVEGTTDALRESDPSEALGRIWRALSTMGTDQAYIVRETERLVPGHRKRVDPIPGAPLLLSWPDHEQLRRSNNVLVFLSHARDAVRAELSEAVACIQVKTSDTVHVVVPALPETAPEPAAAPAPGAAEEAPSPPVSADGEVPAAAEAAPPPLRAPAPSPSRPGLELDVDEIRGLLTTALLRTIVDHPVQHRAARLPVMDAVAQVVVSLRPEMWGALTFDLDDEEEVRVKGAGSGAFLQLWRSDIALDAAAGMLLSKLEGTYSDQLSPPLDTTAITALSKRIVKVLNAL